MNCEIYEMLRSVAQRFEVNEETLALDTIHETGPQNHFLATEHTRANMGQVWQPAIIDRISSWDDWVARGQPAPNEQARQIARQFFAPAHHPPAQNKKQRHRQARLTATQLPSNYKPEPLTCAGRISEIIAAYEKM